MSNPFAMSRTFHKIGHVTNTPAWKVMPTPNGLALLTVTGRRTGKRRRRALRVVRDGDRAYGVALLGEKSDWLLNARAQPHVRIKLGRKTYDAVVRPLDAAERERAAELYRPIAGWYDYFDYANFVWGFPTRGKLLRAHDEWFRKGTPVAFDLALRPAAPVA